MPETAPSYSLMVGPTTGMQVPVKRTTSRIDAPALSSDGGRVAWQMMPRDDWEIFVADVAGSALTRERRVTREIQHDVLPQFIDGDAPHRHGRRTTSSPFVPL